MESIYTSLYIHVHAWSACAYLSIYNNYIQYYNIMQVTKNVGIIFVQGHSTARTYWENM